MDTILEYLGSMFIYVVIALPILLIIRIAWNKFKRRKVIFLHEAGIVLFFSFLSGLFALTFDQDASDEQAALNLLPFKVFADTFQAISSSGFWEPFAINLMGNIIMFIPIGVMLPLLWRKFSVGRTVLAGFLISLFIETVQLTLDRSSDIDDLWLNTTGALIGYGIYKALPLKFSGKFKR